MKIIGKVLILLIVLVSVVAPLTACQQEVTFPDKNLEAAIRDALDKPAGEPITKAELAGLTSILTGVDDITDLSGLEYCTNLQYLSLDENQISDISPLAENSGLGAGDEIWLKNNSLDLSEGSEDMEIIVALMYRGATVYY